MSTKILLRPRDEVPFIGPETGVTIRNGISRFKSPEGSVRFVLSVDGVPIAALQIVTKRAGTPTIANVFTLESARRQGHARALFDVARLHYPRLQHSKPLDRTPEGDAWVRALSGSRPLPGS